MWRILRWLFVIAIIGGGVLWYLGYPIGGKTVKEHLAPILESKTFKEGVRDVRQIVGEGLKAAGEAISEDVTDSERKQLDTMVKDELTQGTPIEGAPGQQALPAAPAPVPQGQAQVHQARPTAEQMLQQAQPVVPAVPEPQAAPAPVPQPVPALPAAPAPLPAKKAPVAQPQGGQVPEEGGY